MKKLFILGLAALLTLAAGCGDKGTDTDGTPPIEGISQTGNMTDDRKIVYIPLWMQDYSVVYYDGELNRTIAQGGDLTEEEIAGREDIDPAQMYGSMTAEPNTKVEYDLHGYIQNVYYLGGFGEYQLSDPTKGSYLLIPLWMKDNSALTYDEMQRITITAGGFLTPQEVAGRQDIADAGGMDAVLLASEPSIRAEYGPDGHLQTIYRISASDGRETACDPAEWPLAEMS